MSSALPFLLSHLPKMITDLRPDEVVSRLRAEIDRLRRGRRRRRTAHVWLRSLGGGVFAALRGGLVAAITQDWLQVGVAV